MTNGNHAAVDFPIEGVDLPEAQQSWKLSQHRTHSAGPVTFLGVNDANVTITPNVDGNWLGSTGKVGKKPEKEDEDFAFLSFFFSHCADNFTAHAATSLQRLSDHLAHFVQRSSTVRDFPQEEVNGDHGYPQKRNAHTLSLKHPRTYKAKQPSL